VPIPDLLVRDKSKVVSWQTCAALGSHMLDAARDLMDLKAPPSNHLEKLKGHLAGLWSIRVNEQYRLIFRFANGNADQVRIVDYH